MYAYTSPFLALYNPLPPSFAFSSSPSLTSPLLYLTLSFSCCPIPPSFSSFFLAVHFFFLNHSSPLFCFFPFLSFPSFSFLCLFSLLQPFLGSSDSVNQISGKIKLGKEVLATLEGHWVRHILLLTACMLLKE